MHVDVATQDAGQSDPHRTGAASSARSAVHDRGGADTAALASGRSENVGYSTGSPWAFSDWTYSGTSGCENRFELSIAVLRNEEVGPYALLTDGRRSNRTLISFVMRRRFAMTAKTRSTLNCTGNEQGTLAATHQPGRGRTRSSCCYARNNVGCSIRWPARRETLLHRSGARPDLVADALNPAQFVSRRSILPTGNLATLC